MLVPFYDPDKSYKENFEQGPFGAFANGEVLANPIGKTYGVDFGYDFLGFKVNSPFGIAAGPLINGNFAQAALDIKGFDLNVIDLRQHASFTDFFVIVSGRSDRQVQAMCDNILEKTKDQHIAPLGVEGYNTGHWILIDFGDVVAHIFYEETRDFYALDKLWGDAPSARLEVKN